jgi:hypothetical protein
LVALSTLAFIAVGGTVGARLLLLSKRTGELPESWMGLGLFLIAAVAYPGGIAVQSGRLTGAAATVAFVVAVLSLTLGNISVGLFVRHVFRPSEGWAAALLAGLVLGWMAFMAACIAVAFRFEPEAYISVGPRLIARQILMVGTMGWSAAEACRFWLQLRRRRAIGLADVVVVNRLGLWALAGGLSAFQGLWLLALGVLGIDPMSDVAARLAIGVLGTFTSVALYLAFLPPVAYLRWLRDADTSGATS